MRFPLAVYLPPAMQVAGVFAFRAIQVDEWMMDAVAMVTEQGPALETRTGRVCGTCTLCCELPEIDEFSKPANVACQHCQAGTGCAIYDRRPSLCRDFLCLWMADDMLGPEWEPSVAHMMVYRQGPQITVLVDPEWSLAWKSEPYAGQLTKWASNAAGEGRYVIVFVGDAVFKVAPALAGV